MPRPLSEAPRMLGRYHLIEALESDELGELFLSRLEGPSGFQRWAVVRRMHPALEREASMVEAFYHAARAAALVQHPNVAVTFDVGLRDGPCWVAREYLHGESAHDLLAQLGLKKTRVPWDIASRIVADIAQGVETLHELRPAPPPGVGFLAGVVTPGRAIVTYDGKTKVVEGCVPLAFGRPTIDASSLAYRAPDLDDAVSNSILSDVFALGVLLWELCVGKRLFGIDPASAARAEPGRNEADVRARVRARIVPPLRSVIKCPATVEDIARRAISLDPSKRQPSCRALARELDACIAAKGLVVHDDDVGGYMLGVFAERFEQREAQLLSAANVTEVFDRSEIAAKAAELQAASQRRPQPPGDDLDDNTETPEVSYAFREPPPPTEGTATLRLPDRPRRDDAETPEVTMAFQLASRPAASLVLPLERKKEALRGFDELPTVKQDSPLEGARPHQYSESVIFVGGDDATVPRERDPAPSPSEQDLGPSGTLRNLPSIVDEGLEESSILSMASGKLAPPTPDPLDATPAGRPPMPVSMPALPPRPPSLSSVLIEQERRFARRRLPPLAFAAMGALAVIALFAYFRWRATRASADEPTAFEDVPEAEASAPPAPIPPVRSAATEGSSTPWRTVAPVASSVSSTADAGATPQLPPSAKPPEPPSPPPPAPHRNAVWRPPPPAAPAAPSGKTGLLTVLCTPACDDVLDGSRSLGPSPVFKVAVAIGSHRLTLKTNSPPKKKIVTVVVGEDEPSVVRESLDGELDERRY